MMVRDGVEIAVIGGSGFYDMPGFELLEQVEVATPFGAPADRIAIAQVGDRKVAFLPRHGRGHRFNPTHVPVRANIYALKSLGVRWVIAVSAVGSLKVKIMPRDLVIPDQIIDRTRSRVNTFFDDLAVHCSFADPFCPVLRGLLVENSERLGLRTHDGGIYVCMEGPLFSTKAESDLHRSWGASVIGMTALPEAKLAREAEMSYATVALVTDYDVWHEEEVTVELVRENLRENLANSQRLIKAAVGEIPLGTATPAQSALAGAIFTDPAAIPDEIKAKYGVLLEKYL